jgi:hypothetical protein
MQDQYRYISLDMQGKLKSCSKTGSVPLKGTLSGQPQQWLESVKTGLERR